MLLRVLITIVPISINFIQQYLPTEKSDLVDMLYLGLMEILLPAATISDFLFYTCRYQGYRTELKRLFKKQNSQVMDISTVTARSL